MWVTWGEAFRYRQYLFQSQLMQTPNQCRPGESHKDVNRRSPHNHTLRDGTSETGLSTTAMVKEKKKKEGKGLHPALATRAVGSSKNMWKYNYRNMLLKRRGICQKEKAHKQGKLYGQCPIQATNDKIRQMEPNTMFIAHACSHGKHQSGRKRASMRSCHLKACHMYSNCHMYRQMM